MGQKKRENGQKGKKQMIHRATVKGDLLFQEITRARPIVQTLFLQEKCQKPIKHPEKLNSQ